MTDKEKIRAEIEQVKKIHESNLDKPMERGRIGHAHGYVDCCDEILAFIDSLPEEKPNVWDRVDINKVIKARVKKTGEIIAGFYDGNGHFDHFIDHDVFDRYSIDDVEIPYEEFIAGLNPPPKIPEMKKEEAIDAEIVKDIHNLLHVKSEALPMPSEHKFGDKVKIIILKDDETKRNYDKRRVSTRADE